MNSHLKSAQLGFSPSLLIPLAIAPPLIYAGFGYYMANYPRKLLPKPTGLAPPEEDLLSGDFPVIYYLAKERLNQKKEEREKKKKQEFSFYEKQGFFYKQAQNPYRQLRTLFRIATTPAGIMLNLVPFTVLALTLPHVRSNIFPVLGSINKKILTQERKEAEKSEYSKLIQFAAVQDMLRRGMPDMAWASMTPEQRKMVIERVKAYGFTDDDIQEVVKPWDEQLEEMKKIVKELEEKNKPKQQKTEDSSSPKATSTIEFQPPLEMEDALPAAIPFEPDSSVMDQPSTREKKASTALLVALPLTQAGLIGTYYVASNFAATPPPVLGVKSPSTMIFKNIRKVPEIAEIEAEYTDPSDIVLHRIQKKIFDTERALAAIAEMKEELQKQKRIAKDKKEIDLELKKLEAEEKQMQQTLKEDQNALNEHLKNRRVPPKRQSSSASLARLFVR